MARGVGVRVCGRKEGSWMCTGVRCPNNVILPGSRISRLKLSKHPLMFLNNHRNNTVLQQHRTSWVQSCVDTSHLLVTKNCSQMLSSRVRRSRNLLIRD